MSLPTKSDALEVIKIYEKTYRSISKLMDESRESLNFWANALNLSNSAISNKKNGRRDWKPNEVRIILETLKKDTSIVDNYTNVLENIDNMIYERGFKKLLFYNRIGLNNIQIFTRQHSKEKGFNSWEIDEIKKLVENL